MAEKLISVYSSLALKDADQIITHALELRVANKLLPNILFKLLESK